IVIIEGKDNIVYSTENWDIEKDIIKVSTIWESLYAQSIIITGKKYSILQLTPERLLATSISEGHIIGVQDDERKIIVEVSTQGNISAIYVVIARLLKSMNSKKPYMARYAQFGKVNNISEFWNKPKLREELMIGLIDFFKNGKKLQKPDEFDLKRREQEKNQRIEELNRVLQALNITKEDKYVNITIKAEFITDYIYDDFKLLKIKRQIENLIKKEFQLSKPFKIKIIKKL
ncbi:MAG: hypothetical protein ACFFAN_20640, partial [Promethearchaeota archaeon]